MQTTETAPIDRLLDPLARCLTRDVAAAIVNFRADAKTQERIDELADKSNEGQLTPEEQAEYEGYVEAIDFVAILQAKARALLAENAGTP